MSCVASAEPLRSPRIVVVSFVNIYVVVVVIVIIISSIIIIIISSSSSSGTQRSARRPVDEMHVFQRKCSRLGQKQVFKSTPMQKHTLYI